MNTPTQITPQVDPDVLKAQLAATEAQLNALEVSRTAALSQNTANRAATDAQNHAQYLTKKGNLTRQKTAVQEQIAKLTTPTTT